MSAANDILIVGGGVIGLAIAVELKLRGATVTVLTRDFQQASTLAAAGMLAPHAEALAVEPMRELCLRSRSLYADWCAKLEQLTGIATGYLPCGILAPVYEEIPGSQQDTSNWLDRQAIHLYQPGLGSDVVGGWWYPEDGQVDNRALAQALRLAAQELGIDLREGVAVEAFEQQNRRVSAVRTSIGEFHANHYVLATGAWASELLPLPVCPKKGQMLSVQMPEGNRQPLPLQRILFGADTYLVPRRDGRLLIGATSEEVGWQPHNTPAGIHALLERAIRLYPSLQDWSIEECWWGFRPATPDELPILGTSPCENLTLATGHYRNGILLAPVTALLLADVIDHQKIDPLLEHFLYDRLYHQSSPNKTSLMISSPITPVTPQASSLAEQLPADSLIIAGRTFRSRLMTGTGKYSSIEFMQQGIAASGSEIVTVAVRRVQTQAPGHEGLAEALDWTQIWMLPNTAGCKTAEEAVRVARLGREMAKLLGQEDNNFVKLEVIPDAKYLLPDPIGTLEAAEQLVKEGFAVLPYINADPMLAKRLEDVGCVTVMPLGSPIGSGQGIKTAANIQIIIEEAGVPVVVDAGIGTPSEAAQAMEMGADALLVNSAIALAKNPVAMGKAMGMATEAGRLAYLAGRIPVKGYASASSPLTGTVS
ncbi:MULTISPECIES: glycine oxidase ThiO [unclassified Coleofasciculus]|uniref:glycine oxidase ThiO n=1 Tax=unclassified Coleofasciculus TaxID=2692782 RepID=UPI00187E561E|nr:MULTISPECIES: glycine oxidase ThiO [unclassified Coleofasciculus]MBE9127027.1 glycine oxidase ThiO [Coleofasciculus sp. LEGE 07081]MBE9149134.1 glycine oxidase ThiO [Coleofasciculus sp. LEGE 07092]